MGADHLTALRTTSNLFFRVEDIFNLVLANSAFGNDFADMPAASTVGRLALASPSDPKAWRNLLQGSNDDAQVRWLTGRRFVVC
jgi:hypothetical protein